MTEYASPERIRIVWFSGTGGTKMAAEQLAGCFEKRGAAVFLQELSAGQQPDDGLKEDLLIIMYPVYALNAPGPIYDYIKNHKKVENMPSAVLSVSGGGEVTPNKACRWRAVKLLERKGYHVVYEAMLIMPANIFTATPAGAAKRLLNALPEKTAKIAGDLLGGVTRRTKPGLFNTVLAVFGGLERFGAKVFGYNIIAGAGCSGCGICADHCPTGNILLENGKPVYGKKCALCMKCLYSCPQKALSPRFGKFFVIKNGFSLADIEKEAENGTAQASPELPIGAAWAGVRKYLEEKD